MLFLPSDPSDSALILLATSGQIFQDIYFVS